MDYITLDEFIAEIETSFSSYADTNDIDRITIKTLVIDNLRKFGKNICDTNEAIVEVKNSRVVLPETFKSLIVALKIEDNKILNEHHKEKQLISEKQYIENPAVWDGIQREYVVNYGESKVVTEKLFINNQLEDRYYDYEWLSLVDGMKRDSLDVKCLNLHPSIRNTQSNRISITNRTLNANFKEGKIYLQYNSLPSDEDGEVVIPILSTGDIKAFIENVAKLKIAEIIGTNGKNAQGLMQWVSIWNQQSRPFYIFAKSEASWNGLKGDRWSKRVYAKNRYNQERYTLPK